MTLTRKSLPSAAVLVLALSAIAAAPLCAQVKIAQGGDRIMIEVDGKPFSDFYIGATTTKPYLHPLRTASGKIVTRHFPMEIVEGETRDHPHHRGLWFTHGEVNGFDFWANEPSQKGDKKGRIVIKRVADMKSGKKSGLVRTLFDWLDPAGTVLLHEDRTMTFYSHPTQRIIDLDIALNAAVKVNFGDTKEGTFAMRLATGLEERHTGTMTNAEGKQKEKEVWGSRSKWVDYAGELEGEKIGIAILDHPENPRHPTYWHSRAYGLFAANPFGESDFLRDKNKRPGLDVAPGETLRFRYRVIIHPGDRTAIDLNDIYAKYAKGK
jgi:hypothetical protein